MVIDTQHDLPLMGTKFPFGLDDLDYFLIVRDDDTVVKFTIDRKKEQEGGGTSSTYGPVWNKGSSVSAYCNHDPAKDPVYVTPGGEVGIWIADSTGTRQHKDEFDLVIDSGNVTDVWKPTATKPKLEGDKELVQLLSGWEQQIPQAGPGKTSILKIDWYDRKAPPLNPEFWPELAAALLPRESAWIDQPYRVLVNCQGGHGRSGSSLVCLMMSYTNYNPLEAITHLRAVHCPRAIESTEQHDYLNKVATMLGRTPNSHDSYKVDSFKDLFMASSHPVAVETRKRLGWDKGVN